MIGVVELAVAGGAFVPEAVLGTLAAALVTGGFCTGVAITVLTMAEAAPW